jgi:hypothetical protein
VSGIWTWWLSLVDIRRSFRGYCYSFYLEADSLFTLNWVRTKTVVLLYVLEVDRICWLYTRGAGVWSLPLYDFHMQYYLRTYKAGTSSCYGGRCEIYQLYVRCLSISSIGHAKLRNFPEEDTTTSGQENLAWLATSSTWLYTSGKLPMQLATSKQQQSRVEVTDRHHIPAASSHS